ncbi:hypothetical protein [Luteimonas terricola]|uniref:Outer membrane protein assembly factor BamE n=1 Tax=Luteimonas terricola TaxID=645597 RepID=A0ABQ2E500_9GAMM|nr:hypothetical protein [Luteimonas terricola]GGJ96099.1 hypothetical protein GCM10011394_01110 [Luteimonas terricola]
MRFRNAVPALVAIAIATAMAPAIARQAAKTEGFLCCNMRSFDGEVYDINYDDEGARIVPFGSPLTVTKQGRRKLRLLVDGEKHVIENHYSRDLSDAEFAARYVVAEDPRIAAAGFPEKIREAIASARITPGMNREQVAMSLGWPVSSENPDLDADVWRFWLGSFEEIQVEFDAAGLVVDASASPLTRRKIWLP